ncbi:MAG: type III pantothenate kinase [Saccharofermentanales bacterium]
MILAIDVGNTNIVMGCVDRDKIYFVARLATNHMKTDVQYAVELKSILELNDFDCSRIDGSIISSVVPPLTNIIKQATLIITGKEPMIVLPGLKTGLNIKIDNPAQLGSDLVVGAVAAMAQYPKPSVIVDLGTATKFSVIDSKGIFLGGVIMPGVNISLDALTSHTAQLPRISLESPKIVIGTNTIDSMNSGIVYGTASMIDGMIARIEDEISMPVTVIATGGLAKFIVSHCKREIIYDPDLMLKGLYLIYSKNEKTKN